MMTAFDGIPLGKVSSSMTINSTASTLLAYYIAVGESQGFKVMNYVEQLKTIFSKNTLQKYLHLSSTTFNEINW